MGGNVETLSLWQQQTCTNNQFLRECNKKQKQRIKAASVMRFCANIQISVPESSSGKPELSFLKTTTISLV